MSINSYVTSVCVLHLSHCTHYRITMPRIYVKTITRKYIFFTNNLQNVRLWPQNKASYMTFGEYEVLITKSFAKNK